MQSLKPSEQREVPGISSMALKSKQLTVKDSFELIDCFCNWLKNLVFQKLWGRLTDRIDVIRIITPPHVSDTYCFVYLLASPGFVRVFSLSQQYIHIWARSQWRIKSSQFYLYSPKLQSWIKWNPQGETWGRATDRDVTKGRQTRVKLQYGDKEGITTLKIMHLIYSCRPKNTTYFTFLWFCIQLGWESVHYD